MARGTSDEEVVHHGICLARRSRAEGSNDVFGDGAHRQVSSLLGQISQPRVLPGSCPKRVKSDLATIFAERVWFRDLRGGRKPSFLGPAHSCQTTGSPVAEA